MPKIYPASVILSGFFIGIIPDSVQQLKKACKPKQWQQHDFYQKETQKNKSAQNGKKP